ncbi:hypothetical protein [Bartonella raoultii]|uniref:hypothetical protein n=1 Tax=Bartonella raoultii TaxID=1457020 RepID=UPI001ABA1EF9|nr:hypothetical protein [Bartonella raoultii]
MAILIKYFGVLGLIIIGILMLMVIIRVPYFLIKYLRLHCKLSQELRKSIIQEKNALQQSRSHEKGMQKQNATLEAKARLLSFKASMMLWPREFKVLFFLYFLYVILQAFFSLANWEWWKNDVSYFIMMLVSIIWIGALLLSPLVALFFVKVSGKLRKTLQQLEEAIVQRDEALRAQDATGGNNDR